MKKNLKTTGWMIPLRIHNQMGNKESSVLPIDSIILMCRDAVIATCPEKNIDKLREDIALRLRRNRLSGVFQSPQETPELQLSLSPFGQASPIVATPSALDLDNPNLSSRQQPNDSSPPPHNSSVYDPASIDEP